MYKFIKIFFIFNCNLDLTIYEYSNIIILKYLHKIINEATMERYAEIFKALAHPIRLRIVCGLAKKDECNVSIMVEKLCVPQPTVSQHLNILKNAGIITGYKKGTQVCYKITDEIAKKIVKALEADLCV